MAGLSQGSEPAVAASPKTAVAASPEDLASLRVSQPLKLSNVPLKWIRDSCEDPRGTPTTDCVVLSQGSEPAVAASHWTKAKRAEYYKQYTARPEVKAKRAKYMKQYMKQYMTSPLPAIAEVPGLSAGEGRQAEVGGAPHRKAG